MPASFLGVASRVFFLVLSRLNGWLVERASIVEEEDENVRKVRIMWSRFRWTCGMLVGAELRYDSIRIECLRG